MRIVIERQVFDAVFAEYADDGFLIWPELKRTDVLEAGWRAMFLELDERVQLAPESTMTMVWSVADGLVGSSAT